ncbi:DUF2490 domain-containing protein [Aureibacter tunicatorum]|uniref:DUF2490 domain-containing protein n=1 Tax=Aureibacter tunicatorum TaxID=866807 RepID=A0AAE4BSB1_9BACT|nr:DUF2490 domain-containing protein [Aureibacter tunicatorum]MDR6239576.1 hypothetical protein [Aureibacter tunicatorum]BDD04053.1 hypothetical protein AUTU_15360 [Aureibacter tunicatorum]
MKRVSLTLFFLIICNTIVSAQSNYFNQLWFDFVPYRKFNHGISVYGDLGYRSGVGSNRWDRVYLMGSVRWKVLDIVELRGGPRVYFDFYPEFNDVFEFRLWQGVNVKWPEIGRVKFAHLGRVEERFFYTFNSDRHSFAMRYRYRLSLSVRLGGEGLKRYFYLPASGELFFNSKNGSDVYHSSGRIMAGLGYVWSEKITYQFTMTAERTREYRIRGVELAGLYYQFKVSYRVLK